MRRISSLVPSIQCAKAKWKYLASLGLRMLTERVVLPWHPTVDVMGQDL